MHSLRRATIVASYLVLSFLTTAGCGDTNNIEQQAGGDAVACVDDASCSRAERAATPRLGGTTSASPDTSDAPASVTPPPGDADSGEDAPGDNTSVDGTSGDGSSGDNPTVAPQSGPSYLSKLKPVGGFGNDRRTGTAELVSGTYGNSVIFTPRYFGSQRLDLTYNIPAGTKKFSAVVGLDQETPDGTKVFFELSGAARTSFTLVPGETRHVEVGIAGPGRITLLVDVLARPSGSVNSHCHAVWGDAQFT